MNRKVIKTALASFGMSGRIFHAPFIDHLDAFELTTILERSKSLSKEEYPHAKIERSYTAICEDPEIDLIIINTPSHLHYGMAKQALLAKKNIVVEKPFTATTSEASELIELAKKHELVLTVYQNKRLESDVKTIQKIIENKTLGKLKELTVQLRRYRPEPGPKKWKEDNFPAAGLLYDIGSHFIDEFLYLFGKPERIESYLKVQRKNGKVNDFFDITFHYDQFKARMIADMLTKNSTFPVVQLKGDKGDYMKFKNDPQEARLGSGKWNWETLGIEDESNFGTVNLDREKTIIPSEEGRYIDFYHNLSEVIKNRKAKLLVEPEEALEVVRIIEEIISK